MKMRWLAKVTYYTNDGEMAKLHPMDELGELEDLIERGPSFYAIKHISIVFNTMGSPHQVVEVGDYTVKAE